MKKNKFIALIIIATLIWQGKASAGYLRPLPSGEKRVSLEEGLAGFGIRITGNGFNYDDVPHNVDWVMNEIRPEKTPGRPARAIVSQLNDMPPAELVHNMDEIRRLPQLAGPGTTSAGTYIGLVKWKGEKRPAVIKLFKEGTREEFKRNELVFAQAYDEIGTNPYFYGVIRDASGNIIGYAMQLAIGETMEKGSPQARRYPDVRTILVRAGAVGLMVPGNFMITRTGRIIGLDAGDGDIFDTLRQIFDAFLHEHSTQAIALAAV